MKKLAVVFLLLALRAAADSLWSPDFSGYLGGGVAVRVGDTVTVTFVEGFSLSFEAASVDSKRLNLTLSGGPYGDLLSFLPAASAEASGSVRGDSQATLKGSVSARVTAVEGNVLTLAGARTLTINGREESVALNAQVNLRDLSASRTVSFSRLMDPTVVYRGPLEPFEDLIRPEDLVAQQPAAAAQPAATPAAQPAAGAAPAAAQPQPVPAAAPQPQQTRYRLSDARQRELVLRYLNRIIDILF